jgi:VWFA-related protein
LVILAVCPAWGQFKSTVPLVIAPTSVTDGKGRWIDGLTAQELLFYDHNVPQTIQVDTEVHPLSLVVLLQAGASAQAVLDKTYRLGGLLSALLAGEGGETAIVAFSDTVRVVQPFTDDSAALSKSLRNLRVMGSGCSLVDAMAEGLRLLDTRSGKRRVMLIVGERRDRSSKTPFETLLHSANLQNTSIYWVTYSTFLVPYTSRRKTVWDRMTDEEKARPERMQGDLKTPLPHELTPLPPDEMPGNLLAVFTELAHRRKIDAAELLSRTTGARTFSFLKQSGLENAIEAVAEEVHRQYIVTFQPKLDAPEVFHEIRAEVKGRPDLLVRTRAGYWPVQ